VPYLSASAVVIHEEALYQVYASLPLYHKRQNHAGCLEQVLHNFGARVSQVFVTCGFCDRKITFTLHFLD